MQAFMKGTASVVTVVEDGLQLYCPSRGLEGGKSRRSSIGADQPSSSLDLILPPIHVIHPGEVVGAFDDRLGVARRCEFLLEVGLFSQNAHLEQRSAIIGPARTDF